MLIIGFFVLTLWILFWPYVSIYVVRWINLIQNLVLLAIMTYLILSQAKLNNYIVEGPSVFFRNEGFLPLLQYDGISAIYIWLTLFIFVVTYLSIWNNTKKPKLLLLLLNIIQLLLIGSFYSCDLLNFYIMFEGILIPMFLLIGIFGSRSEKIKATYYLFFYTLVGSVLFIIGILYLQVVDGTTNSFLIVLESPLAQKILWIFFFIAFAVKIPMFPFYIWLPEAHVEAPTCGSVILAALLLKLGSYAYLRFLLPIFSVETTSYFWPVVISLAGSSVVLASLTAIRQIDIKRIVAYSSIAHMNLAVLGLFSNVYMGLNGGLVLSVAHGFVSAGMFLLIGVVYDRYHSRLITHYSGLVRTMPIFAIFFILYSLANMGFPLSYNFIGEMGVVMGLLNLNIFYGFIGLLGVLFSVIYVMWLANRLLFGDISTNYISQFYDLEIKEIVYFSFLFLPVLIFGIYPDLLELFWFSDLQLLIM
jgi:proton-translocating NADH-quinone oxidoreductase chain M